MEENALSGPSSTIFGRISGQIFASKCLSVLSIDIRQLDRIENRIQRAHNGLARSHEGLLTGGFLVFWGHFSVGDFVVNGRKNTPGLEYIIISEDTKLNIEANGRREGP